MNATHLNLYQVCRLCLCELNGSSFVPIFDNKDSNLSHKIKSCFSISVEETDRLPNVLCPACTRDVERFYKFKEKVLKNNAFLRTYVSQRERKATQFIYRKEDGQIVGTAAQPSSPVKQPKGGRSAVSAGSGKGSGGNKRMPSKNIKPEANASAGVVESSECLSSLTGYSCELSNTLFDNSNKVKVEIIPQVDNDVYSSTSYSDLKSNVVEMWSSSPTEDVVASSSGAVFRPIKSEDAEAVANLESAEGKSSGTDYGGVIRHSSDDFGPNNSSFDKYISVHMKEEVCKEGGEEYDSEDTKSAASLTFREEDEDKLIIDEETMEVKQIVNLRGGGGEVKPADGCILLRTLISTSNPNQIVQVGDQLAKVVKKKVSTFSPQILVNEMSEYSADLGNDSSPRACGTPNSEKSSTRRKQKCPTKSANEIIADAGDETDDESRAELAPLSEQPMQPIMYHQEIVNISPVTVTCSSNGGEEIVGYNQSQFLDEVLSRHSSPATSPQMVGSSQAERLHKACDVLLRAASKIQDLPPGIQHEEEVVIEEEGESITLYTNVDPLADVPNEQITIRHNPVPLYEINFASVNAINDANRSTKKVKSRDKLQQNMPQHKECNNCHAVQTTIWRRDRFGNIVCNACGLYYKLHNYDRPCRMRRDEIHKRNRKRNLNENKAKKPKRNSGGNVELDSSREQENSSGSFTPPSSYGDGANHVTIPDLYHPYNTVGGAGTVVVATAGGSAIKKRRRSSGPGSLSGASQFMKEEIDGEFQPQLHETQSNIDNIEEISVNGSEMSDGVSNHGFGQPTDKVTVSAFQLSTHFVPINGKAYEEEEEVEDFTNENSMGETPLNLATDSH